MSVRCTANDRLKAFRTDAGFEKFELAGHQVGLVSNVVGALVSRLAGATLASNV